MASESDDDIPCIDPPPVIELAAAFVNSKKWPTPVRLKVAFIDHPKPPANLRNRILSHMNAWSDFCDVKFSESANEPEVRITLKGRGAWSGVGTDILQKSAGEPTMQLGGLTMEAEESIFRRTVRHETGHTLGFRHEHLRAELIKWIDPRKAIEHYGGPPSYWDAQTTKHNVLTPLSTHNLTTTETVDVHSVMCYPLPKSILKPGAPKIIGGKDISQTDKDLAASVYPFPPVAVKNKNRLVYSEAFPAPAKRVGTADIVGFGVDGVVIVWNRYPSSAVEVTKDFSDSTNWRNEHPRFLADVTGTGTKDIVGFGAKGLNVAVNNGNNTFRKRRLVLSDYGTNSGWEVDKHLRFMVDVRGTGRADILGFGPAGVVLSRNEGDLKFSKPSLVLKAFGYSQGWHLDTHHRFLGDTTGNGLPDIVGFGVKGVYVAKNNGDGTFQNSVLVTEDFGTNDGYKIDKHLRTIADLTGDGKVDLVGFGNTGVWVGFNNGDGTFQARQRVLESFGHERGNWRVETHPRFIADITGDGKGDIVGFGKKGVWVATNKGDGTFNEKKLVIKDYGYEAGNWDVGRHVRVPVDMTGDGRADIVGIKLNNIWISYNQGNGEFSPRTKLISTSGLGWTQDTIRIVTNIS